MVRPGNRSLALGREGSLFASASGYQWKGREGAVKEVKLMTQEREPFKGRDVSRGRYLELPHVESRWNEDHPERTAE